MKKKIVLLLLIVIACVHIVMAITIPNPSFSMSPSGNYQRPPNVHTTPGVFTVYGYTPFDVEFRDTSSGSYACIGWNFNDGTYIYGKRFDRNIANPIHTFYYQDMGISSPGKIYPRDFPVNLYIGVPEGTTGAPCSYMEYAVTGTSGVETVFISQGLVSVFPTPKPTPVVTTIPPGWHLVTTVETIVPTSVKTIVPTTKITTVPITIATPTTVPTTTINYSATIVEMQKQIAELNAKNEKQNNWIDIWQVKGFCGSEALTMNYVEHFYLWGNDGFLTKRYDVNYIGLPNVKTDISKFEFDTYKQTYCSASTTLNQPTIPTQLETTITTIRTPTPTPIPTIQHKITDGFWCRDTTPVINNVITHVRECYQFFSDGTYKWGYYPGWAMGKSLSCSGDPNAKCEYSFNSKGQYEVEGGQAFILSGDTLNNPHDYPSFEWSPTGIP
jgi:hypothetical protein